MIAIVWRYRVDPHHRGRFEAAYGPSGDWARLFARSDAFRGTSLLGDGNGLFLTLDHWNEAGDFEAFLARHGEDYHALDEQTESWTISEERIGQFATIA